jgi:hypothetical protein
MVSHKGESNLTRDCLRISAISFLLLSFAEHLPAAAKK